MVTARPTPFDGQPAPTGAQRAAILREEHILLAAGAGSGKTTTLVDKILHALGAERVAGHAPARPCELGEIAAITFTNAAAADLKRKLRTRIRAVADWHAARGDAPEEARWRARVYEVDRARIGTIHSFCGQILREFALRLGIDPGFRVLDEGEGSVLRAECAAEALQRALREDEGARQLAEQLGLRRTESLVADLAGRGEVVAESLAAWFEGGAPRLEALRHAIGAQRAGWGCADGEGEWRGAVDDEAARLAGVALSLAARARAVLDERLAREGALDFDGFITRTRAALAENPSVLAAVRRRLAWLFVDEFQDTDGAQLEIAYLVAGFPDGLPAGQAPRLCIVGDPKQSIYRFRRADVTLWRRVVADFEARGIAPIALDTNFRSRAPIVAFVNATFRGLIGDGPESVLASGHEVPYAPLVSHRAAPGDDDLVELLCTPSDGTADVRRAAEALHVVSRIRRMVDDREALIWDDGPRRMRAVEWRDVAVVFRARTAVPAFEAALRAHGVPYFVAGGAGFFARREIRDLQLLLQALADPHDDVAWLGLLRSPLVGLADQALLAFRVAQPERPLSELLDHASGDVVARARAWLADARRLRDRVSVAELLRFAIDRAGFAPLLLAEPDGALRLANVRKLVRLAEARPADTVADLVAFMEERERGGARDAEAALFTAGEDVVTLTTVHSAKGLEWPVVFLVDTARPIDESRNRPALIADPRAGVALRLLDPTAFGDDRASSGAWECLAAREQSLARAEEKRLWYVAATRARDRLVVTASEADVRETHARIDAGEAAGTVRHWLLRALRPEDGWFGYADGDADYRVGETIELPRAAERPAPSALPAHDAVRAVGVDASLAARAAAHPAPIHLPRRSATELMLLDRSRDEYRARYVFGLPDRRVFPRSASGAAPAGVPARVLGDVLHGALEAARDDAELDAFLEHRLLEQLGDAPGSVRVAGAVAHLRRLVEQSRAHPAVARLYDAPQSERELEFTWFARSETGVHLVRGAMDLVARVDDALEILDVKSHRIRSGEEGRTAGEYRVQMHVYAAALAAITAESPRRFSFFFPETAGESAHALDAASAAEGVRALLDAAHRAQTA